MAEKPKTELKDGDQIILKLSEGHWQAYVKFATGGMSGRIIASKSFDEAIAALKQDYAL